MFTISKESCTGCGLCTKDCPFEQIQIDKDNKAEFLNTNCMKCGHCLAVCPNNAITTDDYDVTEVTPIDKESFALNPEQLLNFMKSCRSTRQFKSQKIEKNLLEKIVEAGRFSATGMNAQDVSFSIVTENLEQIKALTYETLNQMGTYIVGYPTKENEASQQYAKLWIKSYKEYTESNGEIDPLFNHAPAIIVTSAYYSPNAFIASANMNLMVNALGLGGYYNGFFSNAANENKEIISKLHIEKGKTIISALCIGYPDVTYLRTVPRKQAHIEWL